MIHYYNSRDHNNEFYCDDIWLIIFVCLRILSIKVAAATAVSVVAATAAQQQQKLPKERAASDPIGHWPLSNQLLFLRMKSDGRALFSHFTSSRTSRRSRSNISCSIESLLRNLLCLAAPCDLYQQKWKAEPVAPLFRGHDVVDQLFFVSDFFHYIWLEDVLASLPGSRWIQHFWQFEPINTCDLTLSFHSNLMYSCVNI